VNVLKRELAPITPRAWSHIEGEARSALEANLSSRRVVDVSEPMGFEFSSVNLGSLRPAHQVDHGVHYGVRRVLPLVEARVPIELDIWTLDDLERGARGVDTEAVTRAALELSAFEERAIYSGFEPAGILGLAAAAEPETMELPADVEGYSDVVARAVLRLVDRGVQGPFALVLGSKPYRLLHSDQSADPPRDQISKLLNGPLWHSAVLDGGFLLSLRGGDFELTLGQDASLGYDWHDKAKVHIYLTESFTFRVLGPEAVVPLSLASNT
jgi:uncharacterized linocin/CFP29 family protein